jgi:hypothetical protein
MSGSGMSGAGCEVGSSTLPDLSSGRPACELVVFPRAGVWMAERVGDPRTFELFGSTVVETAYLSTMPAADVCGELRLLNPGVRVDYFDDEATWAADVRAMGRISVELLEAARMAGVGGPWRRCPECRRLFDLSHEVDADEVAYGHDCEV